MTGALTGTRSPYSGRTSITGFSPQAYPFNWYTRANIGHHWGAELKRAGYDGVLITGAAESPVQIIVRDDQVTIAPADDLWGLDTFDTQEALGARLGKQVRALCIGPAGERLSASPRFTPVPPPPPDRAVWGSHGFEKAQGHLGNGVRGGFRPRSRVA